MFGHQDEPTKKPAEDEAVEVKQDDASSSVNNAVVSPAITPQFNPHKDDDSTSGAPSVALPNAGDGDTTTDHLIDIKQQALQQLTPLVGHLEQSPEEKFRTTMMMIQASDNQTLIKTAYEAAQAITDEKTRAQALLDIVNEINYFTQHQANK
jgi:hypothetical protein